MSKTPEQQKSNSSDQSLGVWSHLPQSFHPYIFIARLDRSIGWWLLILPGWWIAAVLSDTLISAFWLMGLFTLGGITMRGAGCIVNDLWDRRIDAQVARTASRPLASGAITPFKALIFLIFLSVIGLLVLLSLPQRSWLVAIASFPLIICYPLAKRVMGWPQLVLGITFSWAVPVAASVLSAAWLTLPLFAVYVGTVMWITGYDTIYAVQDQEDDKIAGIKSSALSLGRYLRAGVFCFYTSALLFWSYGFFMMLGPGLWLVGLGGAAAHLYWQISQLTEMSPQTALRLFVSNRTAGLILTAGLLLSHLPSQIF
jgi:4-hydroxybenzoate polyprenyltransferase